jgi:hypothetical protein
MFLDPFPDFCPHCILIGIVVVASHEEHLEVWGAAEAGNLMASLAGRRRLGRSGLLISIIRRASLAAYLLYLEAIVS